MPGSQTLIHTGRKGSYRTYEVGATLEMNGRMLGFQPGDDIWVDKDHADASDNNDGFSPRDPLLTVQEGVDKTTSGAHDRVHVVTASSAYAENVTVTSQDYVSIIGEGNPSHWGRPDIHPAAGVGLIVSLSQGFYMNRVYAFSDDGDACQIDSEGWGLDDCKFQGVSDGLLLKGHPTNDSYAAGQGRARGNTFEACGAAGVRMEHANATSGIGAWGNEFTHGNIFRDNTGADFLSAVGASGGGAGIFMALLIDGNFFLDVGAAHVYFDMDQGVGADLAANQALLSNNRFADLAFVIGQCAIGGQPNVIFGGGNFDATGIIDGSGFNA